VIFSEIKNSNHFFKDKEKDLAYEIEKYLKEKTALI
jgi:alpha/beta superfamily hydrolase